LDEYTHIYTQFLFQAKKLKLGNVSMAAIICAQQAQAKWVISLKNKEELLTSKPSNPHHDQFIWVFSRSFITISM
jgi:hypothetical protein